MRRRLAARFRVGARFLTRNSPAKYLFSSSTVGPMKLELDLEGLFDLVRLSFGVLHFYNKLLDCWYDKWVGAVGFGGNMSKNGLYAVIE